tara:strand:+ start:128 stop:538 length:411 start_codon:yes stop_codon:yes gene_type:complete
MIMDEKHVTRRYYAAFIPAMVIFLGGSLGLVWLDASIDLPGTVLAALALVPIIALLSTFWIHWRYMQEIDEYLRQIQVKALLSGAAVVLAIATGWGYLESYVDAPALPIFWLNPISWVAYGVTAAFVTKRETGSFE